MLSKAAARQRRGRLHRTIVKTISSREAIQIQRAGALLAANLACVLATCSKHATSGLLKFDNNPTNEAQRPVEAMFRATKSSKTNLLSARHWNH
jgi:hypothetical protein